jgi:hypothetical protein
MRTYDEISADAREGSAFSNSTQFEIWAAGRGCYSCHNDDLGIGGDTLHCPILSAALMGVTPREWTAETDEDHVYGRYVCSEYDERPDDDDGPDGDPEPDPGPPPVIDGQIDMFEVFADRIADEVSQVRAGAVAS